MRFIDDQTKVCRGILYATGQLVLMGSHQQKFGQLQNAGAPLQDRFDVLPLLPWSIATVMDIAQAHGWDRRPARFHTLWTAYDGMPREWERFARGPNTPERLRQGWEPPSDDEDQDRAQDELWYKAFVQYERDRIQRYPRQRWDSKAYVELPPALRTAIIWLGAHRDPRTLATGITNAAPMPG